MNESKEFKGIWYLPNNRDNAVKIGCPEPTALCWRGGDQCGRNKFHPYKIGRAYGSRIPMNEMPANKFRRNSLCCSRGF